jgi:hypothetical protein
MQYKPSCDINIDLLANKIFNTLRNKDTNNPFFLLSLVLLATVKYWGPKLA